MTDPSSNPFPGVSLPRASISQNALVAGLCPLVPLPILDEMLRKSVMKATYVAIGRQLGQPLDEPAAEALADPGNIALVGCLIAGLWWPIRKLLKTFFYFLTVKECLDWAAEAAVRAEMVRVAFARGLLPDHASEVRQAMDRAWDRHGASPVVSFLLRRSVDVVPWPGTGLAPLIGLLARQGGGAAVLAHFTGILDGHAVVRAPAVEGA